MFSDEERNDFAEFIKKYNYTAERFLEVLGTEVKEVKRENAKAKQETQRRKNETLLGKCFRDNKEECYYKVMMLGHGNDVVCLSSPFWLEVYYSGDSCDEARFADYVDLCSIDADRFWNRLKEVTLEEFDNSVRNWTEKVLNLVI